jgi:hypothetical protein
MTNHSESHTGSYSFAATGGILVSTYRADCKAVTPLTLHTRTVRIRQLVAARQHAVGVGISRCAFHVGCALRGGVGVTAATFSFRHLLPSSLTLGAAVLQGQSV